MKFSIVTLLLVIIGASAVYHHRKVSKLEHAVNTLEGNAALINKRKVVNEIFTHPDCYFSISTGAEFASYSGRTHVSYSLITPGEKSLILRAAVLRELNLSDEQLAGLSADEQTERLYAAIQASGVVTGR